MEACNDSYLLSFIATAVLFFIFGRFSRQIQDSISGYLPQATPKGDDYASLGESGIADTEGGQQLYRPTQPSNWGSELNNRQ